MQLKYLKTSGNRILNGECSFNDKIQSLWEYTSTINHKDMKYNFNIFFKNGELKEFRGYEDYEKLLQDADNYIDEITNKN